MTPINHLIEHDWAPLHLSILLGEKILFKAVIKLILALLHDGTQELIYFIDKM